MLIFCLTISQDGQPHQKPVQQEGPQEAVQGGDAGTGRRRQDHHPLLPQTRGRPHDHPHHRLQRGGTHLQDLQVHGVGRGGTGKTAQPLEPLLRQLQSPDLCGGQFRQRAGQPGLQGAAPDHQPPRHAESSDPGAGQQTGRSHYKFIRPAAETRNKRPQTQLGHLPHHRHQIALRKRPARSHAVAGRQHREHRAPQGQDRSGLRNDCTYIWTSIASMNHLIRAQRSPKLPPIDSTSPPKIGSSHSNSRCCSLMHSLSAMNWSLRKYTLLSSPTTPTLDWVAKIFLAGTSRGKAAGWYLSYMPLQNTLPVSVLKMRDPALASKSTTFSFLQSPSKVLAKESNSQSLMTSGLSLAPNRPVLLRPQQYSLPLSSSIRMKRSMAVNFFILAWRLLKNYSTIFEGRGTYDLNSNIGRRNSPLPQAQKCPLSHRATEKSLAAATPTTLSFWKYSWGIRTGTPEEPLPSTPKALPKPQEQTEPSSVRARECLVPQLMVVTLSLGSSKESLLGSSLSAVEACPSLPSSSSPVVQTPLSLVTKPRWYCPVDTLTTSLKFSTKAGVQYWELTGRPQPWVVSPQVRRCPEVAKVLRSMVVSMSCKVQIL